MGRPRKPIHIKASQGTLRPSREVKTPLGLEDIGYIPEPPKDLGTEGAKYWRFVWNYLHEIGQAKKAFYFSVERACLWWDILQDAMKNIKDNGYSKTTKNQYSATTAAFRVALDGTKVLKDFEREFGLTLLSSQRIEGGEPGNDLEALLN